MPGLLGACYAEIERNWWKYESLRLKREFIERVRFWY